MKHITEPYFGCKASPSTRRRTTPSTPHPYSAFHQALFHRRQARGLQNRCRHIPKRLRPWRERRHGRAERLPDAYDANRKTTRGHLLLSHRPPRLYILHNRRQGQHRPVRRLPALRRTTRGRTFVYGGDAV